MYLRNPSISYDDNCYDKSATFQVYIYIYICAFFFVFYACAHLNVLFIFNLQWTWSMHLFLLSMHVKTPQQMINSKPFLVIKFPSKKVCYTPSHKYTKVGQYATMVIFSNGIFCKYFKFELGRRRIRLNVSQKNEENILGSLKFFHGRRRAEQHLDWSLFLDGVGAPLKKRPF